MNAVRIAVPLFLFLFVVAAVSFWWLRNRTGVMTRGFHSSVIRMERDRAIRDRYRMPWLLLLGDTYQGERLCSGWKLRPVGKPFWFGRWWADQDGAVLAVPENLFLPEEESGPVPLAAWRRLLGLLLRLRPRRPLDGVVWVVSISRLSDDGKIVSDAFNAQRRFADLLQRMGLSLPVYVVISGMEEIAGFLEMAAALPKRTHEGALGWSSPFAPEAAWQPQWLDTALDGTMQAMRTAILEIGTLNGTLKDDLYRLPSRLDTVRGNLHALFDPVFQGNAQGEGPRFRGLYFCMAPGQRENSEAEERETPFPFNDFSCLLWQRRILAERGLARAVPSILRLRQRWLRVAGTIAVTLGLLWSASMLWVWHGEVRDAQELSRLLQETREYGASINYPSHHPERVRQHLRGFWDLLQRAPRWHYASAVFPSSWFSSFDEEVEKKLRTVAQNEVLQPAHAFLEENFAAHRSFRDGERHAGESADNPEQWPEYRKALRLAEAAATLEQRNRWYAGMVNGAGGLLEPLAQFAQSMHTASPDGGTPPESTLNPASLPHKAYYDHVLADFSGTGLKPLDLKSLRPLVSDRFQKHAGAWLTRYFLADDFVSSAENLKRRLKDLRAGRGASLGELEQAALMIDDLQEKVELTNSVWSRGSTQEPVPGYRRLLEQVRQSSLLGPEAEETLNGQISQLRRRLRDYWIAREDASDNLLEYHPGGILALQGHVIGLGEAIKDLLKRDFVTVSLDRETAGTDTGNVADMTAARFLAIDGKGLVKALNYYDGYRSYTGQGGTQIPSAFRATLLKTAQGAADAAMWSSLAAAVPGEGQCSFGFPLEQVNQVLQAFTAMERTDRSGVLLHYLNRCAIDDISVALAEIDALPVFGRYFDVMQWNGGKNFGLRLFHARDVRSLRRDLMRQFTAALEICEAHAPALAWLKNRQDLSVTDGIKVHRLAALNKEMADFKAQKPGSAPALFEQLVSRDFVEMDTVSCAEILHAAPLVEGNGKLARLTRAFREEAQQRCGQLQQHRAAAAWNKIANYFDLYLSHRFPFSPDLEASDADPVRVRNLLGLIDSHLAQAEEGLKPSPLAGQEDARDFLGRLRQIRPWLGALLLRGSPDQAGIDLEVQWRIHREGETGGDQVIAWNFYAGARRIGYPDGTSRRLRWYLGEPVWLQLRWAKDSPQRPLIDPRQPEMTVSGLEAGWKYEGPWALLRLLRAHATAEYPPGGEYSDFPLVLHLPVGDAIGKSRQARMFVLFSLISRDEKVSLSIPPLPVKAPPSPFVDVGDRGAS